MWHTINISALETIKCSLTHFYEMKLAFTGKMFQRYHSTQWSCEDEFWCSIFSYWIRSSSKYALKPNERCIVARFRHGPINQSLSPMLVHTSRTSPECFYTQNRSLCLLASGDITTDYSSQSMPLPISQHILLSPVSILHSTKYFWNDVCITWLLK